MTNLLDPALLELDDALSKLGAAIDDRAKASRSISELRAELLIARDDVVRLKEERDQLKEENKKLVALGEASTVKLDEAIGAIQTLLAQMESK